MKTSCCGCLQQPCGCCEGVQASTPVAIRNRPALPALAYRVGTHARFLSSMKARLSTIKVETVGADGEPGPTLRPLQALTARDSSDFSIALLDGWATVADVLTFYQERIANEGFLRTATERRSVLELSKLVGYKLRPGVASTVFLAYALDDSQTEATTIKAGARAQSLPGPGETPQSFETSEDLIARREWNDLAPRREKPQHVSLGNALVIDTLHVAGTATHLKAGDPLLMVFGRGATATSAMRSVRAVDSPVGNGNSAIRLSAVPLEIAATIGMLMRLVARIAPHKTGSSGATMFVIEAAESALHAALMDHAGDPAEWADDIRQVADGVSILPAVEQALDDFERQVADALEVSVVEPPPPLTDPAIFVADLLKPRVEQARSSVDLRRDLGRAFRPGADTSPQLLLGFAPTLKESYYAAWEGANVNDAAAELSGVFALRTSSSLFGSSVPRQAVFSNGVLAPPSQWTEWPVDEDESANAVYLEMPQPSITASSYAVVQRLDAAQPGRRLIAVTKAEAAQRSAYGISGKSTRLTFDRDWWNASSTDMAVLRAALVYAQSEPLTLIAEPITEPVAGQRIELGALYRELTSGRWVILSGERADIDGVGGVRVSELMMVSGLEHGYDPALPGDKAHTTLLLATTTAFAYRRETLTIHGNVVKATRGETSTETLGSGDGATPLQSFALKQPPLTFVPAPTAAGAESTLAVYVDNVKWKEAESLAWLGTKDRGYSTATADDGVTVLTFGDGEHGERLPTGVQNVAAVYRNGIGAPGNVRAGQISMLQTRPLGVKGVVNPLAAAGGADREGRDLARENAPLSVMALDRLVSVQDYADFTRRFAGIAKAIATQASDGAREVVFLTIAGADDAPIDPVSDLYRNLLAALRDLGDPDLPIRVDVRELKALTLSAGVRIAPEYRWEAVASALREALLDRFGFGRRALGQRVRLSEVIAAMQAVRGVIYVNVDVLDAIPEKVGDDGTRRLITQDEIAARIARVTGGDSESTAGVGRKRLRQPPDVPAWPGGVDRGLLRPAELVIFTPSVPDTLILNPI